MSKSGIFWLVMLTILLTLEIILSAISCDPTSGFKSNVIYDNPSQSVKISPGGVELKAEEPVAKELPPQVSTLTSVIVYVWIAVVIIGAGAWIGYKT